MKICLVRHGETDWNSAGRFQGLEDIPLNKTGIEQMQKAAAFFKKTTWDEVITSPLKRAKMSAEIIREAAGLETIHEEAGFLERDLGKISGMTKEEAAANFPNGNYEGCEPLEKLRDRTVNALLKWAKRFDGKNIIIVSHGAAIHSVLSTLSGEKIEIGKNASISLLEKQGEVITILFHNKNENEL